MRQRQPPPALVTSFRMYNATPRTRAAWAALFAPVFAELGLDVRIIEHAFPQPIDALWREPGLCAAFMCGWPFVRSMRGMQAIAAPVPSPPRYAGQARYCSEFLVREDSNFSTLEHTFGHRFGWMAEDSQSGFNAPRAHLARFITPQRPALYAQVVGPLGTPARTVQALRAREVDVVAVDSFFLDLCRHHEPARLAGLRCVATTAWTPIPLLVAAPAVDAAVVAALRAAVLGLHERADTAQRLGEVRLARFVAPDLPAYEALSEMAAFAASRGYDTIR